MQFFFYIITDTSTLEVSPFHGIALYKSTFIYCIYLQHTMLITTIQNVTLNST